MCFPNFCGYNRDQSIKYVHRSLPYKGPIRDETGQLEKELDKVFAPVIASAHLYADLGSSQQCEHANREVTLRAPKSFHYGNSESLDFRVKATAAFINEGRGYISKAHADAGLSPGIHTQTYSQKCLEERKRRLKRSSLPSAKRRRLVLKQERCVNKEATEILEGATYQSGIGLQEEVDIERIPDAVPRGDFKPLKLENSLPKFVVLDLETTDLIRNGMPHITQIAAREIESGSEFSTYILPKEPITQDAQQTTDISVAGDIMYVNGTAVETASIQCAVDDFLKWTQRYDKVVLVSHNGRRFDFPVLLTAVSNVNRLDQFLANAAGCADSLSLFRKTYTNRGSYKQEDLARDILCIEYNAHNAVEDVRTLVKLFQHSQTLFPDVLKFSFSTKGLYHHLQSSKEKAKNIQSLTCLVGSGVCKLPTAENIAASGLNLGRLRKIYNRDGADGLHTTFT